MRKHANPQEFNDLLHFLDLIKEGINYHEGFKVFGLIGSIVNTDEKVEEGVFELIRSLSEDNVVHAEIRTGLKDLGSGLGGCLQAVLQGIERGCLEFPIKVGLLLSLCRDTPKEIAGKTIDLVIAYKEKKAVVGLDLSGDSTVGDGKEAIGALKKGALAGLPITLHLGESEKETDEEQLFELQGLKPARIGHCVHIGDQAKAWIKEHQTPVEMCLSSAYKVQMVESMDCHPALCLLKEEHPVIVCTDDTTLFGVSLSDELVNLFEIGISFSKIEELQKAALQYSFLNF